MRLQVRILMINFLIFTLQRDEALTTAEIRDIKINTILR
jgi:hypothetical protein